MRKLEERVFNEIVEELLKNNVDHFVKDMMLILFPSEKNISDYHLPISANEKNLKLYAIELIKDFTNEDVLKRYKYVTHKGDIFFVINDSLTIKNKNIEDISNIEGLGELIFLKKLDLSQNKITEIKGLDSLTNLTNLILHNNKILVIKGLENLIDVEYLDLSSNKIKKIEGIENQSKLKVLGLNCETDLIQKLGGFRIGGRPHWAVKYPERIVRYCQDLKDKQITDPLQKGAIDDLKKLVLHSDVEYEVKNGNVVEIFFWQNWISELPESISNLKYLEELNLGMNDLSNLPESFTNLTYLKELFLDGNNFETFPEELLKCLNLEWLDLSDNNLMSIPESISKLKNLKILNVGYNHNLKTLPESLVKLKNLVDLDLTQCYDVIIPNKFKSMNNLKIKGLDDLTTDKQGNMIIELLIRDYGTPAVDYYQDEEMRKNLIDSDKLVISDEKIKIRFTYPLSKGAIFNYENKGGFTRLDLYRCIYQGYKRIYDEEEKDVGDPGTYKHVLNRKRSNGPYGVWGHYLSELWIESITYNTHTKTVDMFIGS